MKFKKLLSIIIFICFIVLIILFFQYKPLEKTNISTKNISEENSTDIENRSVSHDYSNFRVSSGTSFEVTIDLSSSQPYGKAFYANNLPYNATLYVEGQGTVTVKPYSSNSIVWKKGTFKSSYDVSITATQGMLDGYFSLAKATRESEFQN